ncbi:helix-hairpin-helix domain-containing protein [Fibrobacter sp. UWB11]|uniref:ComEA family DNA-binding protein n=1 Tax=Fibrobacter sp. UWB11 TaxID=1896202 RepID=UPI0020C9A983|nr:helix-hairpin-helix domain-containing protein [Fibrobacter sp. UWB11]
MNASEKRILKLAIILFTIGLIIRYLPWGLPSIETFEVGESVFVANTAPGAVPNASSDAVPNASSDAVPNATTDTIVNKIKPIANPDFEVRQEGQVPFEHHRKVKKKVTLPLHINTAGVDDLCALKGVGPKLAEKIIEHRNAFGPFKSPSDLKKVHGIGKKKLENLLHSIIFD